MIKDEIIQEVWLAKDSVASKHGHDVEALAKALRRKERRSAVEVVDLHGKRKA